MSVPKTVHLIPKGRRPNPRATQYNAQTGHIVEQHAAMGLINIQASTDFLKEFPQSKLEELAKSAYVSMDVDTPYDRSVIETVTEAEVNGMVLRVGRMSERYRRLSETIAGEQRDVEVTEGQNPDLVGKQHRRGKMKSKVTAFLTKKNADQRYVPLEGDALAEYNRYVDQMFDMGGISAKQKVELAQRKKQIASHLRVNARKLFLFFDTRNLNLSKNRQLDPYVVAEFLESLGFHTQSTFRDTAELRAFLFEEGALSKVVWSIAAELQTIKRKRYRAYHTQSHKVFFDHHKGGQIHQPRLYGDLEKALDVLVERVMDQPLERALLAAWKGSGTDIARFSGNAYNLGLYGAENAGLDNSRESSGRVALRMAAKRLVVQRLQSLASKNPKKMERYARKLRPELVVEFLGLMGLSSGQHSENDHEHLIQLVRDKSELIEKLNSTYVSVVNGPCGHLQQAGFLVGMVLGAVQHITGETSLYCSHNGDFTAVSGLQQDLLNRTYMAVRPKTLMFHMFSDHKRLSLHSAKYTVPTDCVHSQAILAVLGSEEEATMVLRLILSDILPDFQRLVVRISGQATLHHGADKPYRQYGGKKVLGCSRFAHYPHLYDVAEGMNQEELIVEALEFVYQDDDRDRALLIATQHHDDAEWGDDPHHDFSDEMAIEDRKALNGERTMLQKSIEESLKRYYGVQDEEAEQANVMRRAHHLLETYMSQEGGDVQARELGQLKALAADRWLKHANISNADIQRNAELCKARFLDSSMEARLYEIFFDGTPACLPETQEVIEKRVNLAYQRGLPDLYRLVAGFTRAADNLECLLKTGLEDRKTYVSGPMPLQTKLRLFHRPLKGWEGTTNYVSSLPAGIIGCVAVPVMLAQALLLAINVIPGLSSAGVSILIALGIATTGLGLLLQGGVMAWSTKRVKRRLQRVGWEQEQSYGHASELWKAWREAPAPKKVREASLQSLRLDLPDVLRALGTLQDGVRDRGPESVDGVTAHRELEQNLKDISAFFEQASHSGVVMELSDINRVVEHFSLALAITTYLDERYPSLKETIDGARKALEIEHEKWEALLKSDEFQAERHLSTQLHSMRTAKLELDMAQVDNRVYRRTGLIYMAAGSLYIAATTAFADVFPLSAPLASALMTLAFLGNYLNTRRHQRRTQEAELDVHAEHGQPWSPKTVGFHRGMLSRQAEQVEANRRKNNGVRWRSMGWGAALVSMAMITISGLASMITSGVALLIWLALGLFSAVVLNFSVYNLFTRHAARCAAYGPKPESTVHAFSMESNERKRSFWSLGKQLAQTLEQKHYMLEQLDANRQKMLGAYYNLFPLKKGVRSPLLDEMEITYATDARRPWMYILEKFVRPNASRQAQARAIETAFSADWQADVHHPSYAMRLYTEHELNSLRDRLGTMLESHRRFTRLIDVYCDPGASEQDDLKRLRVEREILDDQIKDVTAQITGANLFVDQLEQFGLDYHRFEHCTETQLQGDVVRQQFEDLIVDFAHRMGFLGHLYRRRDIRKLARAFPNDLQLETYGRRQHIANIRCRPNQELSPEFRHALKNDDQFRCGKPIKNGRVAFRHLANLMVFVITDTLQYKVDKLNQNEIQGRKSVLIPRRLSA